MQTHEQYNGVFLPTNSNFSGILKIDGADTTLKLAGKYAWNQPNEKHIDIHGTLIDGKKASLLQCIPSGTTTYYTEDGPQTENSFIPNYIVIGEEFISSEELTIQAISYHFENIHGLMLGSDTFKELRPSSDAIKQLLESDSERIREIAAKQGWPPPSSKTNLGDSPHILYFSGEWEILSCETEIGKFSLTNRTSHNRGSSAGIGIKNEVTASIEFTENKAPDAALDAFSTLHSFFELSLGYRQRYLWIELTLQFPSKIYGKDMPQTARLYWSLGNEHVHGNPVANMHDVLLSPDRDKEEFINVATNWMNSQEILMDPRERFATAFYGKYSIDRIVGAANMFDLLPESHTPKAREIDEPLRDAMDQCRQTFRRLQHSIARSSVLSALGRVDKASLSDKIYHRADKVIAASGNQFPELYLPCKHAVLARNHYVHGSGSGFEYQKNFTEFAFIIDTLEFVFAASDLIDLGWNLKNWMDRGSSMSHPFSAYMINYPFNLKRLKALVDKKRLG